jgi:hypothetical protein
MKGCFRITKQPLVLTKENVIGAIRAFIVADKGFMKI